MSEGDFSYEEISKMKEGRFLLIEGIPCKISNITRSKAGKHGHAKARIEAVGITDGKKRIIVKGSGEKVQVPMILKKPAQVLSLTKTTTSSDGETKESIKAQVMDLENYETFELEVPEELKDKVTEGSQVIYWEMMGQKMMTQMR